MSARDLPGEFIEGAELEAVRRHLLGREVAAIGNIRAVLTKAMESEEGAGICVASPYFKIVESVLAEAVCAIAGELYGVPA